MMTYGVMAALIGGSASEEPPIILPETPCRYKLSKYEKETQMISAPQIFEVDYDVISPHAELEKIISDVLEVLIKKPSQLDLEMLSMMDDDIWDLF